ncbi:MAG: ParB N-terminal domain-containing protein, partial [bacterium]|nr:ParB N-terminal domain-containing protein [bacterium]
MDKKLNIQYVPVADLRPAPYNPRKHSKEQSDQLKESIKKFGVVDPILANSAPSRKNIVIGGHFRLEVVKEMGFKEVPVVYINVPDIEKEKEICIRLNLNTGEFDWTLLADFDEIFLKDVGFSSEDLDDIFGVDENPEIFDLQKELKKLNITKILIKKGDVWQLGQHKLMCGDSTIAADMTKLMGGDKASLCLTDPPYRLDYLKGKKKNGKATEGFGYKRDRKYL